METATDITFFSPCFKILTREHLKMLWCLNSHLFEIKWKLEDQQ